MNKFAKIENEETKVVLVGTGTDTKFYESIGMTLQEVEQGYNGSWYLKGYAPKKPKELIEAEVLAQAKQERAEEVFKITVEVDGLIFDGDEDSQTRMARTITASQALGLPEDSTISWAMADTNANKVEQVTIAQLSKALYLAGCKQSELWCKPYGVTGTTQTGLEYLNSLGQ